MDATTDYLCCTRDQHYWGRITCQCGEHEWNKVRVDQLEAENAELRAQLAARESDFRTQDALLEKIAELQRRNEELEDVHQSIRNWIRAYPLDVFPEPDFKLVRELLASGGITLDAVSASNMRHVLTGIEKILDGKEE